MNSDNKSKVENLTARKKFLQAAIVAALATIDANSCIHLEKMDADILACRLVVGYSAELESVRIALAAASLDVDSNDIEK